MKDQPQASSTRCARGRAGPKALPRLLERIEDLARYEDTVSIGALTDVLGARSHAPILMFAALFMILPVGMVPGVGGMLGVIAALIGLQMIRGRRGVWLPGFVRRREVPGHQVRRSVRIIRPVVERMSRHLRTRLSILAEGRVSLALIALILVLGGASMIVFGAIPFAIPLVGLPIACFAVGILSGDGAVVAAGYVILIAAVAMLLIT